MRKIYIYLNLSEIRHTKNSNIHIQKANYVDCHFVSPKQLIIKILSCLSNKTHNKKKQHLKVTREMPNETKGTLLSWYEICLRTRLRNIAQTNQSTLKESSHSKAALPTSFFSRCAFMWITIEGMFAAIFVCHDSYFGYTLYSKTTQNYYETKTKRHFCHLYRFNRIACSVCAFVHCLNYVIEAIKYDLRQCLNE